MSILSFFKKILLAFIKGDLLGLLLRGGIVFGIMFYLVPYFYSLGSNLTKLELSVLLIVLIELIVLKIGKKTKVPTKDDKKAKVASLKKLFSSQLDYIIKNKPCFIFLHSTDISIDSVLANQNYSIIEAEALEGLGIQLYYNFHNVIISFEVGEFNKIKDDPSYNKVNRKILSFLKSTKYPSVSLFMSVNDLVDLGEGATVFYKNVYSCMQYINSALKKNYNINLVIDKLASIKGFYDFVSAKREENHRRLGIQYITDISSSSATLGTFEDEFEAFSEKLKKELFESNIKDVSKYQASYYFVEQVRTLHSLIARLLENIVTPSRRLFFKRTKDVLLTVNFIDSAAETKLIFPILDRKLEKCVKKTEVNNG